MQIAELGKSFFGFLNLLWIIIVRAYIRLIAFENAEKSNIQLVPELLTSSDRQKSNS